MRGLRNTGPVGREVLARRLFRRVRLIGIDAVFIGRGLGSVQTSLGLVCPTLAEIKELSGGDHAFRISDKPSKFVAGIGTDTRRPSRGNTHLDQVLAFGLGDERLEFRGREGVDEAGLRDDEQENLGASQDGQLVRLESETRRSAARLRVGRGRGC